MAPVTPILQAHVQALAAWYQTRMSPDGAYVQVADLVLPAGYNVPRTAVLLHVAPEYPLRPPTAYVQPGLRHQGRRPRNIVEGYGPGWGQWAWVCVYRIAWRPERGDDLVAFLELIRSVLSRAEVA